MGNTVTLIEEIFIPSLEPNACWNIGFDGANLNFDIANSNYLLWIVDHILWTHQQKFATKELILAQSSKSSKDNLRVIAVILSGGLNTILFVSLSKNINH